MMGDYEILSNLENELRDLIKEELSKITQNWWEERIPDRVRDYAERRKKSDDERGYQQTEKYPLISYVDFRDYEEIIVKKENWDDSFKKVFGDRERFSVKLKELQPIRRIIAHTRPLSDDDKRRLNFYSEEILLAIKYHRNQKSTKKLSKEIPQISVSSDRTIYPINSVVHVQVNSPEIIDGESIQIKVYDPQGKIIVEREIDPKLQPENQATGIYETTYEMKDQNWKIHHAYTIRATYGTSEAEDSYTIDQRWPAVQSDKSVYYWGEDMILTVIDPDADKDSNKIEFVGDRKDSNLIIKSNKKTLENYRLRETGESTAIFQGTVGFIGVKENGDVEGYWIKNKLITSTQGYEYDDGFIEVGEEEEMTIEYSNNVGKTTLTVFVMKPDKIKRELAKPKLPLSSNKHLVIISKGSSSPGCEKTNDCFSPSVVEIKQGETVMWINVDNAAHTVTNETNLFDSSIVMPNKSFSYKFDVIGEYSYIDVIHPWMKGRIVVK